MTNKEKQQLIHSKTIAYYSGYNGIEIKNIDYTNEKIYFVAGSFGGGMTVHSSLIKYTASGKAYFTYNNKRIPLDECIRT